MAPKRTRQKPVAAYLRLSEVRDDSVSIDGQERLAREAVERAGLSGDVVLFRDEGISGSKNVRRPARDDLERRLAAGEFAALVVKSVDRLARSTADFTRISKVCKDTETALIVSDMALDSTTPTGALVLGVLAQLAEFEASMIGTRVRTSNVDRVAKGRALGGPVPYGFRNVKRDDAHGTFRAIDPEEADVVRRIVSALIEGRSMRSIALALNDDGVATPRASAGKAVWDFRSIERVASNPAIAGMRLFRGDLVRDDDGLPLVDPALQVVSGADYRAALEAIGRRKQPGARRKVESERLLLDGLATCAGCEASLRRKATRGGRYVSYACPNSCAGAATVSRDRLDAHVTEEALRTFGRFPVLERIESGDPEVAEALATVKEEAGRAHTAMLTADPDEAADLFTRWQTLRAREGDLEERLAASVGTVEVPTGETFAEAWEATDDHASRRALLAGLIGEIRVWAAGGDSKVSLRERVAILSPGGEI